MTLRDAATRIVFALVVAGAAYFGVNSLYIKPRQQRLDRIETLTGQISRHEKLLRGAPEVRARAKSVGELLLGIERDEVNARFRDGLARVAEQCGLSGMTVETGSARDATSPLVDVRDVPMSLRRELRRNADFAVLQGTLKGSGTLDQALRLVAYLESQAWVHRIEEVSLRPMGRDRRRFEVRVVAATILAPDLARLAGPRGPEPLIALASAKAEESIREMVRKNVFARPAAPDGKPAQSPVVVIGETPAPPPARVFPAYEEWKLTGVAIGRAGTEAFFVNIRTGEKITLQRGGALLDAIFLEGKGETAVIEIGGKRFEISNGQTLAARKPLG
jgi:hypothetical protein